MNRKTRNRTSRSRKEWTRKSETLKKTTKRPMNIGKIIEIEQEKHEEESIVELDVKLTNVNEVHG